MIKYFLRKTEGLARPQIYKSVISYYQKYNSSQPRAEYYYTIKCD